MSKAFSKSKRSVNLLALTIDFSPVAYNCDQLSFTAECMSSVWSDKSLCSSKCAKIYEQTICSGSFHGTQVRETGQ